MSNRREVAFQAIEGYNKWTIDAIMEYRDESCIQQVLPSRSGDVPLLPLTSNTSAWRHRVTNNSAHSIP